MRILTSPAFILLALGGVISGGASAITVSACGPNVCYDYDDTQTALTLTGTPTLVGDSMQFLPPAFAAQSSNGAGWVTVGGPDAYFIFSRVYTVNPLDEITAFTVGEEFDYEIISGSDTAGTVAAALYVLATSNVLGTDNTSNTESFTDSGDTGGMLIEGIVTQIYPAGAFTAIANDMQVGIQNTLSAYTDAAGELAFIQKKFTLTTNTIMNSTIVPLPAALWMLGSALGVLGMMRRRSTND